MNDTLLGISSEYLYFYKKPPEKILDYHRPYFLAFRSNDRDTETSRRELIRKWENNKFNDNQLSKIEKIGEIEEYKSFWDFEKKRKIFKVFTMKSYFVPEVSDYLFFNHGFYTAEHDIPYHQRSLLDLAADGKTWLFDTNGAKKKLDILIYDIETSQFNEGNADVPIDIIGYSSFDITFESQKNLDNEEFSFEITDCPLFDETIDVKQFISRNVDEEIDNLYQMCKIFNSYDIISGHNILGFDNFQVYNRINWILKNYRSSLSNEKINLFENFVNLFSKRDKSFHFGSSSEIVNFYPCSFDTYHGARKFYSFLNEFGLKSLAQFLNVRVRDRIFLTPSQIKIDQRTLKYNRQDVVEQTGVSIDLIQQALPLAFTTCMTFESLLSSGAVNMWDHMALLRGAIQHKIMPPICRPKTISKFLLKNFKECNTREEIVKIAKQKKEQLSKDFIRVLKYGDEMPEWVEYPYVVYNESAEDDEESLNYHIPGGMTIKPDKEAHSHFVPWYHVVVADVGAMYPTILKAMNVGGDTVRLAKKSENPDAWIWLKKLPLRFLKSRDINWREVNSSDSFADEGYIIGVKIDSKPGVVNLAMTGIMSMISKIKKELKDVKTKDDKLELQRLKMMYQSVKGARNAGTHGILSAPGVSGRQFNIWGAATITTKGQMILDDTLRDLEKDGVRVVYGDTDGLYLGCSRSVGNLPDFSKALGVFVEKNDDDWLTPPDKAISVIEKANNKWRKDLNYSDFELEPEVHDAMIFVKHKNYLIFDSKNGKIEMIAKGNNFKGSDKANIARKVLNEIMVEVLRENPCWNDEEEARESVKNSILSKTNDILLKMDWSKVDIDDLTLVQSVQPAKRYKLNQDGSVSVFGKRSQALEALLSYPIRTRIKLKFVVTKRPLPGITNPSKSGVKPIDYMYPVDLLNDMREVDLEWYKKMIENYIQGAFGLSGVASTEQTGLDAWM